MTTLPFPFHLKKPGLWHFAWIFFFLTTFQSCSSVTLISPYDELTDQAVTQLEQKVTGYFIKLSRVAGTPDGDYKNFTGQLDEIAVLLNTLEVRAKAVPKNDLVVQQLDLLKQMLANQEQLHQLGFRDSQTALAAKPAFDVAFTSIIKLQMALKRGEK